MYQSWSKSDPADAIIKLIEERERKEIEYSPYENESANWSIVSYKDSGERSGRPRSQRDAEQGFSTSYRGVEREQRDARPRESWEQSHSEIVPKGRWSSTREESHSKPLKAEIDFEWRVRKRSPSPNERVDSRLRRQHASPEKSQYVKIVQKRIRSRSRSIDSKRERRRSRSRSNSRSTKPVRSDQRYYRSRSRSREGKHKRSGSKNRQRSNSRDHKHQRHSSKERSYDRSDRYSRSRESPTPKSAAPVPENSTVAETADILSKFVSIIKGVKEQPAQIAPNGNVLPEFDSDNNAHTIRAWLLRVDDVAKLFGWGDKETIQFALPKLVGAAKTWYETLETVPYSWSDWKKKLKEQFDCPNFGQLINEMSRRQTRITETLEEYYHAKLLLVNRCGFKGAYAVECILSGVKVDSIRLCAEAAEFAEPEELLKYLKGVEDLWTANKNALTNNLEKPLKPVVGIKGTAKKTIECYYCGKAGHAQNNCRFKQAQKKFVKNVKPGKLLKKKKQEDNNPVPFEPQQQFDPTQQFQPPQWFPPAQQFQPPQPFQPQPFQSPQPFVQKPKKMCFTCGNLGHVARHCSFIMKKQKRLPNSNTGAPGNGLFEPSPPGVGGEDMTLVSSASPTDSLD